MKYYNLLEDNSIVNYFVRNINVGGTTYNYTETYETQDLPNEDIYYICNGAANNCGPIPETSTEYTPNDFFEGDFNGDGISEIVIRKLDSAGFNQTHTFVTAMGGSCTTCNQSSNGSVYSYYMVDLNPLAPNPLKLINGSLGFNSISNKIIADFNGDGKSDILSIDNGGRYSITTLKESTDGIEVEYLASGTIKDYNIKKQILFGDYNGDGKTDIMIPDSDGGSGQTKWHTYYSNQNPAGGEFFIKESQDIVEYWPNTGNTYNTQTHLSNYYAIDINGDGKSDLVRVRRRYYKDDWSINNHDTQWQVTGYTNNIGKVGASGFALTYDSGIFTSNSPDIPVPVTSNYKYKGANTELVIVRGHYNKIEYYQFNKDLDTDNRLQSVKESNGNIIQNIEYLPMESSDGGLGNSATDFYSSKNASIYPNIEILHNPNTYLVSKLTAKINQEYKVQNFKYHGFTSNYNYGTVGFKRTSRSSWYNSSATKIWTTTNNDENLRGATTITWTSTNPESVFENVPTNLVSTKTNYFAINSKGSGSGGTSNNDQADITISSPITSNVNYVANNSITAASVVNSDLIVNYQAPVIILKDGFAVKSGNNGDFKASTAVGSGTGNSTTTYNTTGVYNILLTKQTFKDHITDLLTETSYTYDGAVDSSDSYGLQTQAITKQYSGTSLQGTTTKITGYDNNPAGDGKEYYIGRPNKLSTTISIYTGDTRTSAETYTYTGHELTKIEKKGHNTPDTFVEDMTYDSVGNLLTKKVSVLGATIPVIPRTITDEYEATKRFVIKKTDHQGFITNYAYNSIGLVTQSTDHLGIKSDFIYDDWGKLITSTITNAAATPLVTNTTYTKLADGGYLSTSTNNTEGQSIVQYDVIGRAIINTTKAFATGTTISKKVVYDVLGRKLKESEPYFSSPNLWTVFEYDYLQRPTKITSATNKMQTIAYEGLTSTINDDGKTSTATVDALGNKTQTTDPGGAINFVYYATGQLKNLIIKEIKSR